MISRNKSLSGPITDQLKRLIARDSKRFLQEVGAGNIAAYNNNNNANNTISNNMTTNISFEDDLKKTTIH